MGPKPQPEMEVPRPDTDERPYTPESERDPPLRGVVRHTQGLLLRAEGCASGSYYLKLGTAAHWEIGLGDFTLGLRPNAFKMKHDAITTGVYQRMTTQRPTHGLSKFGRRDNQPEIAGGNTIFTWSTR